MPIVSVLLPVYNASPYLAQAVNSILIQSCADLELLIIDDGSTDDSLAILKSYSDPRIKLLSRENRGLISTLNELIGISKGQFLARMDADDISEINRLALQVDFLRTHTEVGAVGCRGLFIDSLGEELGAFHDVLTHGAIDAALMQAKLGIIHPSLMMRREAINAVGVYRKQFRHAEDLDLLLRIGERYRLHNLSETLLRYRIHGGSVSDKNGAEQWRSAWAAIGDARLRRHLPVVDMPARLPDPSQSDLLRRWGWLALGHGNVATARKYAFRVLIRQPGRSESWKLLLCAIRDQWRRRRLSRPAKPAFQLSEI